MPYYCRMVGLPYSVTMNTINRWFQVNSFANIRTRFYTFLDTFWQIYSTLSFWVLLRFHSRFFHYLAWFFQIFGMEMQLLYCKRSSWVGGFWVFLKFCLSFLENVSLSFKFLGLSFFQNVQKKPWDLFIYKGAGGFWLIWGFWLI